MSDFCRKSPCHETPSWVPDGETYFITINCEKQTINHLAKPDILDAIRKSVKLYESTRRWRVHLLLLMPDHLHGLIAFNTSACSISKTVASWKRYLNREHQIGWQKNFFEHRIRSDHEFEIKSNYIRENPVRESLCARAEDWPFLLEYR